MTSESESTHTWKDKDALRAELVPLLQAKRYEDALSLLYRARAAWPHDEELSVSIEQVKGFLVIKYARKLGGLDRVAPALPASVVRTPEVMLLARYINGYSSFDDLAQVSPLGRLRTLQVLVSLYTESTPPPIEAEPSSGLRLPGDLRVASNTRLRSELDEPPDTARSAALQTGVAGGSSAAGSSVASSSVASSDVASSDVASSSTITGGSVSRGVTSGAIGGGITPSASRAMSSNVSESESVAPSVSAGSAVASNPAMSAPVSESSSSRAPALASIFQPPPDAEYQRNYANGTTAYVQKRYADAVHAFQACVDLRPSDQSAAVMLKRSLSELKLLG